jgi:3-dehydrosphinganine reductase
MKTNYFLKKKVLITGGSSGIGLELARQLQVLGAKLILLARDEEKLQAAKSILEGLGSAPVTLVSVDISKPAALQKALEPFYEVSALPDILINSAGFSRPGYVEEIPLDVFQSTMDVNFMGTVSVTKAFLPGFLKRGTGQIVNISSLAGVIGTFGYSAYGASKFAIRGFSDVLRAELKSRGIAVSIVFPPDTDTPQLHWEAQYKPFETKVLAGSDKPLPVSLVAKEILTAISKKKYIIVPGAMAKLQYWLATHTGKLPFWVMDLLVADACKKKARLPDQQNE